MRKLFKLRDHNTTASQEILCGVTTFLTMSYILFVNPAIVSGSGMPSAGISAATVLTAALCSFMMGFFANAPFAMAPGMGLNTFFTYIICSDLGFHWQEALALVFISGALHIFIMATNLRKALVNAIPQHLKLAFGVGLGLFIGYVGLKSAGIIMFTSPPGQYALLENGTVISTAAAVPSLINTITAPELISLIGLAVMLILLALERKTGDSYAALPIGILTAAFIGIPLHVTNLMGVKFIDFSVIQEISKVSFAFWGDPGIMSLVNTPNKLLISCLVVLILLVTDVIDSIGTIVGIGQVKKAEVFTDQDLERFRDKRHTTKLDKVLLCNSFGGSLAALLGTTTTTTYMESITGIVAGGKTGLTAVVVGSLFLLCLPFANLFSVIPAQAIAPALIVAGAFMVPLAARIDWNNFEEGFPAFVTVLCIPLTFSFVHGIAAGVISHIIIQIAVGKWRQIHPMLYAIAVIFVLVVCSENWF